VTGLRIIAGQWGGRRIRTPAGSEVRPTPERVREALFSILGERVPGACVLDAFSGSGALGLEALSRGADRAVFVECAPAALEVLRGNVRSLGASDRAGVVGRIPVALRRRDLGGTFDLILADPPYARDPVPGLLGALVEECLLVRDGWLVVERDARRPQPTVPAPWSLFRSARYGDTRLDFYRLMGPETAETGAPRAGPAGRPGGPG
jgi:16S rRNA (guanine966-N2)-methyltransferase